MQLFTLSMSCVDMADIIYFPSGLTSNRVSIFEVCSLYGKPLYIHVHIFQQHGVPLAD